MKKIIIWIGTLMLSIAAQAQLPQCSITHYSSDEGLSQKTVMYIVEDHTGFMWFSTWNGLSKFDGYSFTNYKAGKDNLLNLSNNRIDFMGEDRYGYMWVQTYDDHVYRFDTQRENFTLVGKDEKTDKIKILRNGHVWLLLKNGGATRLTTNATDHTLSSSLFSVRNGMVRAQHILDIYLDRLGHEWLLTDCGLYVFNRGSNRPLTLYASRENQFFCSAEDAGTVAFGSTGGRIFVYNKHTKRFFLVRLATRSDITAIKPLPDNTSFIATRDDGFFVYNTRLRSATHYTTKNCHGLPTNNIYNVYVDRHGEVWIDQHVEAVVVHFNPFTRKLKREKMQVDKESIPGSYPPFKILEDANGYLWVHPYGGGFAYYDRRHDKLLPFFNTTGSSDWRFSNKLHALASDRQGNLWMSTHSKGLEKITFTKNYFHNVRLIPQDYESSSNNVRSIFIERDKHRIWYGTRDGSIRIYDIASKHYLGSLDSHGAITKGAATNSGAAYNMMKDSRGRIWIAVKGQGLMKLEDERGGHFRLTRYRHDVRNPYSLSDDNVYFVHEDKNHRLWLATFGGGIDCLSEDGHGNVRFLHCRNELRGWPAECMRVRMITSDTQGNLWVGTTGGAVSFSADFTSPSHIKFFRYCRQLGNTGSLSDNDVYWITCTSDGQLFLATFGGGLNKLVHRDASGHALFKTYTTGNGLLNNVLLSIQEDNRHGLWISSESGLTRFNPRNEEAEMYDNTHFSALAGFNEGASASLDRSILFFGSSDGITYFSSDSIHKSRFVPSIVLSRLSIWQKAVDPADHGSVLRSSLNNTADISLSHKQNFFSIQYAALDMTAPEKIKYAYKLDGFDKDWNYVDGQRTAVYTNIPKGHYTFRVKSTNSDGVWVANERTLLITVRPSFWERPIAYLLYVLLFFFITFATVYTILIFYRLKHKVQMEKEISDLKLRFFTNVSHELRTPLTLIAGPVEQVLLNPHLPADSRALLSVVKRNSDRMLHFVNQILDFRKIQNKKMKLCVQQIEVVAFTRRVMDNFNQIAADHQIDYVFESEKPEMFLWADADKLEMIIFNLLSNAFKYTPAGKMISVFIAEDEHTISIGIQDQGVGISERERKSLFVRFENLIDKNIFSQEASTGIGLSLVKEFADMHKATIDVDSTPGKGSTFTVNFLKGKKHFDETVEYILDDYTPTDTSAKDNPTAATSEGEPPHDEESTADKPLLLLVEDNVELRTFLRSIFATKYRIIEAGDGDEGMTKALRYVPDFIISDVIMPRKDGIEMTKELRANLVTCHIPIIILTAKTTTDDKLEGLEGGADSYITKPFSSAYLQASVDNILKRRKVLQELFRRQFTAEEGSSIPSPSAEEEGGAAALPPTDRKFMNKLMELMETNMDNGELMVDDLARELALSRSVFFKKLKALTGLAPIEYIREVRINRAAKLIETSELSMTEIAEQVGINDSRYFSKCFKHQFGITPTEYKEKKKNVN